MASNEPQKPHVWRFFRSGGFDQVQLSSGSDLAALGELDAKLWAALACPSSGLEMDPRTLELLDADGDGRIRIPEVVEAANWAARLLKNPDDLFAPSDALPLDAISDATPAGAEVLASARQILDGLGKSDAAALSIEDTVDTNRIFAQTQFNGDGIIPPAAAADEATRKVIEEAMACVGADTDRSGAQACRRAQDAKRDLPVPLSPCARRQPFVAPARPASPPDCSTRSPRLRQWLDGATRCALRTRLRDFGVTTPPSLRRYARALRLSGALRLGLRPSVAHRW